MSQPPPLVGQPNWDFVTQQHGKLDTDYQLVNSLCVKYASSHQDRKDEGVLSSYPMQDAEKQQTTKTRWSRTPNSDHHSYFGTKSDQDEGCMPLGTTLLGSPGPMEWVLI
jgi:hypothetical protein